MYITKNLKEKNIRDTAETLYRKRYEGITEITSYTYPYFMKDDDCYDTNIQREFGKFSDNFLGSMMPETREILFTKNLLNELDDIAVENNVELSTLINCYLLQMLERNKRTVDHTKGRRMYVKNTLYATSTYIDKVESLENFESNILDKDFINYRELSYKNRDLDEEIYIQNYLLNNGYSIEQIEQIVREEKEMQGTFMSSEGEVMNPKTIPMEMVIKECPALNMDYDVYLFIPARLGLHYILLNKVETFKTYESIENFLISKLSANKNIWDLYAEYLSDALI